jgi:hypothetical protein
MLTKLVIYTRKDSEILQITIDRASGLYRGDKECIYNFGGETR